MASGDSFGHLISPKTYTAVLGILLVLTIITVGVSYFDFGALNDFIAIGIAAVKAYFVVMIFMHGKFEGHEIWMYIYTPFFLIGLLLSALFLDYGVRPREDFLQDPIPLTKQETYIQEHGIYGSDHGGDHGSDHSNAAAHDTADAGEDLTANTEDHTEPAGAAGEGEVADESLHAEASSNVVPGTPDWGELSGDAEAGRKVAEVQCIACHVVGDKGNALPIAPAFEASAALDRITPEYLRKWFDNPQEVKPGTAMPDLPLSEEDIENLIAFLATYKK